MGLELPTFRLRSERSYPLGHEALLVKESVYKLHSIFFKNIFLRTRASDFSKIKNNLSLVSEKLRTKTHFSLK